MAAPSTSTEARQPCVVIIRTDKFRRKQRPFSSPQAPPVWAPVAPLYFVRPTGLQKPHGLHARATPSSGNLTRHAFRSQAVPVGVRTSHPIHPYHQLLCCLESDISFPEPKPTSTSLPRLPLPRHVLFVSDSLAYAWSQPPISLPPIRALLFVAVV